MYLDTGKCVSESLATLLLQQRQLIEGRRKVQMFPTGTIELVLPDSFCRHENFRGVFHYDGKKITSFEIDFIGLLGRENVFLNLGPYSKDDIVQRISKGESLTCISEITMDGTEIRTAVSTNKTLPIQRSYFEETKEPNSLILEGVLPDRIRNKIEKVK